MEAARNQRRGALSRVPRALRSLPSACCIFLVRLYQWTLSPAKAFLFGPNAQCRFEPSCSEYAAQALKLHGAARGSWLAAKRICRCHPWGDCGHDPVPSPGNPNLETRSQPVAEPPLAPEFSR